MRRFPALLFGALILLSACSSDHKKSTPATSTTTSAASSSTTSTPTTAGASTTSTTAASGATTTTTPAGSSSNVKVTNFTYIGDNPVQCTAPSMAEFKWTVSGAQTVTLAIDGNGAFATYPNGTRDVFLPLACDGKSHTYKLTATAGSSTASQSISVQTTKS